MNSAYALVGVLAKLHDDIDRAADLAQTEVAHHVTHARRAMGQHFRKINRDIKNDQNTQ